MEHPEFAPALERLHREDQCRALRDRPCRSHPHDPVSAMLHEWRGALPMRLLQRNTRLPGITGSRAENERTRVAYWRHCGPTDRAYPQHCIYVLGSTVIAEIVRMHSEKFGERTLRGQPGRLATPRLLIGNGCPDPCAPGVQTAFRHLAQFPLVDAIKQLAALIIEGCAQDGT